MKPFWILTFLLIGLIGLFFAGRQIYPRFAASHWRAQLADAPDERVEVIVEQIAELDEVGIPVLVEAIASEREAVARAAKYRLLDRLEQWKALTAEEYSLRLLKLAETLAGQVSKFGPAARSDASDLATRILQCPLESGVSADRSRLIAACDDVLQATMAVQGESSFPPPVRANSAPQAEDNRALARSVVFERWDLDKTAATHFDPLPGGGLPIGVMVAADRDSRKSLPVENGDIPPAYFQEPSGSRLLDFSNRTANPLQVPESALPQNARKNPAAKENPQINPLSHEEANGEEKRNSLNPGTLQTLDLMRQLGDANDGQVESLEAELKRRGLSAAEIGLARRMFDPDPAVRKQLVAKLPGVSDIDASAWLLQCCKDEDADVRLAAFSLLATSTNPALLRKLKDLAQNDSDVRIHRQAEQISEERSK